jgi:dihydroorotase
VIALLSTNPAHLLSLKGRGSLAIGNFADAVVFDPAKQWVFDAKASRSKSKNSPFTGWNMLGQVRATVSEGRIVFRAP